MQEMQTKKQEHTLEMVAPKTAQVIQQFVSDSRRILKGCLIAEYLFGSYATNTQTPLSDIDILILV